MASSMSHLVSTTPSISTEEQANLARMLIQANELYGISNSNQYSQIEREQALEQSSSLAEDVLNALPNHHSALNLMARIELDNANYSRAESLLERAISLLDNDENTMLNLGYLYIAKRQYEEAANWFKKALEENRYSARAFAGVALVKLRQKDYLAAFKHYKRLLELGHDTDLIRSHFLESVEFLNCDAYQADLEGICFDALLWENHDTGKLANFVSSLLVRKYDLDNENALLDLNILTQDRLLIEALNKVLLPRIAVENLLTELRKTILMEVAVTQELREDYQPIALAIGVYASRCDYALIQIQEEETELVALVHAINAVTSQHWQQEDIIGALIVLSMYEPLYTQRFSTQLLRYDVEDWPSKMQDVLQANLYDLCNEHQTSFDLIDSSVESLLSDDIKRCSDRWSHIKSLAKADLYAALGNELGFEQVPERFKTEQINVLLVGCGSGLRAFYLAQVFPNISVTAVDASRENITYTRMMAKRLGIDTIQFVHSGYDDTIIGEDQFDIIEFGEAINHVEKPDQVINDWQSLLKNDGLIRLSLNTRSMQSKLSTVIQLVKDRRLSPTADNIRHLRFAINQEAGSGLWDGLFSEPRFYTGAGCKDLFFHKHNHYFQLADLEELFKHTQLDFTGFVDIPTASMDAVDIYQPGNLKGWMILDQDNQLFDDSIEVYCRKV